MTNERNSGEAVVWTRRMRLLTAIVTSVGILSLTACASSNASSATGGKPAGERVKLAMGLIDTQSLFSQQLREGGVAAAAALNADLQVSAPTTVNPPAAIAQVQSLLNTGLDGIAIAPSPAPLWVKTLKDAEKATGNAVAFDAVPPTGAAVYIGDASFQLGLDSIRSVVQAAKIPPSAVGEVLVGTCVPAATPLQATIAGYQAGLKKYLPKAKIVGPVNTAIDPTKNLATWQALMQAHPKALLAVGPCDVDGPSMIRAKKDIKATTALGLRALGPQAFAGLKDGTVASVVATNWYLQGYITIQYLVARAHGKKLPTGWVDTGHDVVTKENASIFQTRDSSAAQVKKFNAPLIEKLWTAVESGSVKPMSDAS